MRKYLLCMALVSSNVSAETNPVAQMLEIYARQPNVVYVNPQNNLIPIVQPSQITRGNSNFSESDFMLPDARQADRFDLNGTNLGDD